MDLLPEINCEPVILHYLDAIQYALADYEVDASPTVKATGGTN